MDLKSGNTPKEYAKLKKKLLGSLVRKTWGAHGGGAGLIIDTRKWDNDVHVKVAWVSSPFILFQEERSIGWHDYTVVTIISEVKYPI